MRKRLRSSVFLLLFCQLVWVSLLSAQDTGELRITVLSGEGATNSVDGGHATAPVIQVLDAQGEPVSGAEVVFESPTTGPSATFFGATHRVAMQTDPEGRAQPSAIVANTYEGPFTIAVTASQNGRTATAAIQQTNAVAEPAPKKKFFTWRVIAGIAAAVTIVIVAIAKSGGDD